MKRQPKAHNQNNYPPAADRGLKCSGKFLSLVQLAQLILLILLLIWCQSALAWAQKPDAPPTEKKKVDVQAKAREDAKRKEEQIRQTISYGIDSDLVTVIEILLRETSHLPVKEGKDELQWIEETPYNEDIYQRIQKGYSSSELQTEAIRFFMQQKWMGAKKYVIEIISRDADIDNNLLLAALAYLRHLEVKEGEDAVVALLTHENPQIVEQSLITLGKIGRPKSAADMLKLLEDEDNSFIDFTNREQEVLRVAAIQALGELTYSDAAPYLLQILEDAKSDDPEYSNAEWGAAAKALGQMNNLQAVELIVTQFRNGNTQQRYQAVMALSTFPLQSEFEDIILQGLQEAYWKTREEAARTAGQLKLQSAIPSLAYKVSHDSVTGVRRAAIQALRQMGGAGNGALQELMQNPDVGEIHRLDVLRIMVKAQDNIAVGVFRQLLQDEGNISRTALFRVASNNPWTALGFVYQEMLGDRAQKIRMDGLRAIARAKLSSLRGIVRDLAENAAEDPVRRAAQAALTSLNS